MSDENDITELPLVVDVPDQPCQQLYEGNPVLLGFDVVQYHFIPSYNDGGVPVRGLPEFAYNFEGYQFWFSSVENRNLFIEDPWRYAPAWGGFCSWGVALELPPQWPWQVNFLGPPASPWTGWLVVNGTLMFNIWASYSDQFMSNVEQNVEAAKARWQGWFGQLHAGPFNTHCIGHGPLKNWCLAQQPAPWLEDLPECQTITETPSSSTNETSSSSSSTNETSSPSSSTNETSSSSSSSTTNTNDTTSSTTVTGGGIVSDKNTFEDFANAKYSPHQQRMIKAISATAFVVVLLAVAACLAWYCRRRQRRNRPNKQRRDASTTNTVSAEACDSDEITPTPHDDDDDEEQH